jgi:hypothetical protein
MFAKLVPITTSSQLMVHAKNHVQWATSVPIEFATHAAPIARPAHQTPNAQSVQQVLT